MPPECPKCGGMLIVESGFGYFKTTCSQCGYTREATGSVVIEPPEKQNE